METLVNQQSAVSLTMLIICLLKLPNANFDIALFLAYHTTISCIVDPQCFESRLSQTTTPPPPLTSILSVV